jgi:hypothetical protein
MSMGLGNRPLQRTNQNPSALGAHFETEKGRTARESEPLPATRPRSDFAPTGASRGYLISFLSPNCGFAARRDCEIVDVARNRFHTDF